MNTNYQMIQELDRKYTPKQRGIVDMKEIYLINKVLSLDEMDILQLRNLRDFVVMYYANIIDRYEAEYDKDGRMTTMDKMSAITTVIDTKLFNRGATEYMGRIDNYKEH